ncbi:hypothetical protein [Paenibacillus ihuae]|uniref:hypothetical protein n=1 Tax=Paenibacillus ihuae TaxID=1232431 RepID=UPI0006D55CAA
MQRLLIKGRIEGRAETLCSGIIAGSTGIKVRETGIEACSTGSLGALLQLSQRLGYLLQLLNGSVVALQCMLNDLGGLVLTLSQFFQFHGILLLLLEKLLVILAGLLSLGDKLLDNLLALIDLAGKI